MGLQLVLYTLNLHEIKRKYKFKPDFTFMIKNIVNIVYFFPTFPHFFVTAADYQFWKVPTTPRTWSARAKSLFIVFWNVQIILTKWVIILEFGRRLC